MGPLSSPPESTQPTPSIHPSVHPLCQPVYTRSPVSVGGERPVERGRFGHCSRSRPFYLRSAVFVALPIEIIAENFHIVSRPRLLRPRTIPPPTVRLFPADDLLPPSIPLPPFTDHHLSAVHPPSLSAFIRISLSLSVGECPLEKRVAPSYFADPHPKTAVVRG